MRIVAEIPISWLSPALRWLRIAGKSHTELADAFQCSVDNVAQVLSRLGRQDVARVHEEPTIKRFPPRNRLDIGFADECGRGNAEQFERTIDATFAKYSQSGDYAAGASALRGLLARAGNPSTVELIAARARLHQHRSWFLVHMGFSAAALCEAANARIRLEVAYRESRDAERYLRQWWETGLVCSLAYLHTHQWEAAKQYLTRATDACKRVQKWAGSEHHRQEGVIFLQQGREDEALAEMKRAVHMAEHFDGLPTSGSRKLLLPGVRQASFLERDWEKSKATFEAACEHCPEDSLEFTSNLLWTIATSLDCGPFLRPAAGKTWPTNSGSAEPYGCSLLLKDWPGLRRFYHLRTVFRLLAATPRLRLDPFTPHKWIRWLMYPNVKLSPNRPDSFGRG
jgi:tetratricopeptide (TPR) repeat protein